MASAFLVAGTVCLTAGSIGRTKRAATSQTRIEEPLLGWAARVSPAELRPIYGTAGSTRFGDPVALPEGTTELYLAPRQKTAVARTESGWVLVDVRSGRTRAIDASDDAERVVFSPSGSAAVFVGAENLQVWTGLERTPEAGLRVARDGAAKVAVSDDGEALLVGTESKVSVVTGAYAAPVDESGTAEAIGFRPGSRDAFVAGTGRLLVARDVTNAGNVQVFSFDESRPSIAGAFVGDGVIVAAGTALWRISLVTGLASSVDTGAELTRLDAIPHPAGFVAGELAEAAGKPLLVVNATGGGVDAFQVPAAVAEAVR